MSDVITTPLKPRRPRKPAWGWPAGPPDEAIERSRRLRERRKIMEAIAQSAKAREAMAKTAVSKRTKTEMDCHDCDKNFVAVLDYGLNGDHVIECPHCGHLHLRKILDGVISDTRWSSTSVKIPVLERDVWKAHALPAMTSMASVFIRERWFAIASEGL